MRRRGHPNSPETRAKLRAANLGKTKSPEHCARLSAALRATDGPYGVWPWIAALVLDVCVGLFAYPTWGGEPVPVIPDSRPDRDEIAAMCDGPRGVYAHAWHEQRIMIFGTVYKDGKHDPPYVVVTWDENKKVTGVWRHGVLVTDATKWLEETDVCEFAEASNP